MKKRILVIGTGGTIASVPGKEGLVPGTDTAGLLAFVPQAAGLCNLDQIQLLNLDSTNIGPQQWMKLADCIRNHYNFYDGFLILHGTDTMAYTAAALSFLVQNSPKPIILTGSQKPMESPDTDAKKNLYQGILYAVSDRASDVNIVFGGKVIPGGRARKVKSKSFDAFATVGAPDRARIVNDTVVEISEQKKTKKADFYSQLETRVMDVKITPGLDPKLMTPLLGKYRGIVLEGFGLGGFPEYQEDAWFTVIRELIQAGTVVAAATQVPEEGTDMSIYEVGRRYKDHLNVLEGYTMTPETMLVKLMWILGQTEDPERIRQLFYEKVNCDLI